MLLTDISAPMLRHVEALAAQRGISHQCTFRRCSAERLDAIGDASVDVVTTRAVLAYVSDKAAAMSEFHRILKPGGRISIAEPVFQDDAFATRALRVQLETQSPESMGPFAPLLHRWMAAQFPDTDKAMKNSPITNYSERDLLRLAHRAGFAGLHLELHIDIAPSIIRSWDAFLGSSPHPLAPPLWVILAQQFTEEERLLFERVMRPVVEDPRSVSTVRIVYLTASKPLA